MQNQKVILVTGASSGIGAATAEALIKAGYIVYAVARRLDKMEALKKAGGRPIRMDITQEADIDATVERIMKEQGRLDVLINNAGYAVYGAVETIDIAEAKRQFEVNLFGLGYLTQRVIPHMRRQGAGRIINVSSMGGKMYTPLGAWYHASKHALEGWSDCLRLELAPLGIDVVVIEPGVIRTNFWEVMHEPMLARAQGTAYESMTQKVARATIKSYQEGNGSSPEVIARLILKAVSTKRPRTRYAAGKWALPMMWLRKYAGDRLFDKIILSQVK